MPRTGRTGEPAPRPGEVRTAIRTRADELSIERHPMLTQRVRDVRELRKVRGALTAVSRPQRDRAAVVAQLRADPILICPPSVSMSAPVPASPVPASPDRGSDIAAVSLLAIGRCVSRFGLRPAFDTARVGGPDAVA
jgi:hypothetical protein